MVTIAATKLATRSCFPLPKNALSLFCVYLILWQVIDSELKTNEWLPLSSSIKKRNQIVLQIAIWRFSQQVLIYHIPRATSHTHSLFLFPIVFGRHLIPVFDVKKDDAAVHSIICFRFFDHLQRCLGGGMKSAIFFFWKKKLWSFFIFQHHHADHLRKKERKVRIWEMESVNSSAIYVTSLPSVSLSPSHHTQCTNQFSTWYNNREVYLKIRIIVTWSNRQFTRQPDPRLLPGCYGNLIVNVKRGQSRPKRAWGVDPDRHDWATFTFTIISEVRSCCTEMTEES